MRRQLIIAIAMLAVALALPGAASARACADANESPSATGVEAARHATLCLVNQQRARYGLRRLRENPRLRDAAQRHSTDMVRRRFFAHDAPGGASFVDRIRRAGYLRSGGWSVGENIAWGSQSLATPASIVRSWMHSPGHRANILSRGFREVGTGITLAAPTRVDRGATYTQDFGRIG